MPLIQLPLSLKLHDDALFDNFFMKDNVPTVHQLHLFLQGQSERFIFCYGESGVGKTHLLQACCHRMSEQTGGVFYLPLKNYAMLSPIIFDDLEKQTLVCL